MTVDNTPSGIIKDNEDFIRLLANQASAELLEQHLKPFSADDIQLRYLVLAQMIASFTEQGERMQWSIEFIKMQARHYGVDLDNPEGT